MLFLNGVYKHWKPRESGASFVLSKFHGSDHQQLSKLVQEAPTIAVREDLERELEALVGKMEAKADQISKVRRHRLQVSYFYVHGSVELLS